MMRNSKQKRAALVTLIVAIVGLTVAFSALSSNLTISGNAKLDPINWDIYFDNIANIKKEGKASIESVPVIDTSDRRKINGMSVILVEPGDKVTFTVDLVNESDITAIIKSAKVGIETTPEGIKHDFIEFKAIYKGTNTEVADGNVIAARTAASEERKNITVSIYYSKDKVTNDDLDSIPPDGLEIKFNYGLTFEQSDELANMPVTTAINGCTEFTKKDTYEVGDIISFCNENANYTNSDGLLVKEKSEDFYVIKDNGDTVIALAKYNLMVGNKVSYKVNKLSTEVLPTNADGYGLQNETASAIIVGDFRFESQNWNATKFDDEDIKRFDTNSDDLTGKCIGYWANDDGSLKSEYKVSGITDYPANVYSGSTLIKSYVDTYIYKLKALFQKTTFSGRLVTLSDLQEFGCNIDVSGEVGICDTDEVKQKNGQWIYNATYWTSTANDRNTLWGVISNSAVTSYNDLATYFNSSSIYGVRPVITIDKSEI